jgi:hypothetical protein
MKYAHLDNKKLLGWYDSEIHSNIPTPNVKVSNEMWQTAINIGANAFVDGQFVVKDFSTQEEKNQARIYELKQLLKDSDYKVLPDYDKPDETIKAQRQAWREEIRSLGG